MEPKENVYEFRVTPESLMSDRHEFLCPSTTCDKTLRSVAALQRHMQSCLQTKQVVTMAFRCPVDACVYGRPSRRYFSRLKYLKQHYEKVHATRNFHCKRCNQAFSRQFRLNAHQKQCGKQFVCHCGATYSSREALLTHTKRKQHARLDGFDSPRTPNDETLDKSKENVGLASQTTSFLHTSLPAQPRENSASRGTKPRLLLPKPAPLNSIPLPTLAALALSELSAFADAPSKRDVAIQTSVKNCEACCNVCKNGRRVVVRRSAPLEPHRCSAETQTKGVGIRRHSKRQKACAQTQTSSHQDTGNGNSKGVQDVQDVPQNTTTVMVVVKSNRKAKQSIQTQTSTSVRQGQSRTFPNLADGAESIDSLGKLSASLCSQSFGSKSTNETQTFWTNVELVTEMHHMSSATQTVTRHFGQQCSSSQTERDVFLGHVSSCPYPLDQSYLPIQEFHLGEFAPPVVNKSDCSGHLAYENLFSSEPCTCDKMDAIQVYNSETQTELNLDCLFMCEDEEKETEFDDNILCSNIQTQTSDDVDFLPYEQLLSNMQTQTIENHLLPELTFSDIQTQTICSGVLFGNEHEFAHMETQTGVEMLAPNTMHTHTQTLSKPFDQ